MNILMVNKFLYPKGGSETYMLKLGSHLLSLGHQVEYFGMADEKNIVGNGDNSCTSNLDFHTANIAAKIRYPFRIIYSSEARRKIKPVLDHFKPDIVHLNNINFELTPSILYEIKKYNVPIIQTVHDVQLACPNHRFYNVERGCICTKCTSGQYRHCIQDRCVQGSVLASTIAALESYYYHARNAYNQVDKYICPSSFIAEIIQRSGIERQKIEVICNFSDITEIPDHTENKPYVLYFGRLCKEKGTHTLLSVCAKLHNICFKIAGTGPMENAVKGYENIEFVGFKNGRELYHLISNAEFSLYPSEWYENCPLSVIESLDLGTPVIASNLGGTVELIDDGKTGLIFEGGNADELENAILKLWNAPDLLSKMRRECIKRKRNTIDSYGDRVLQLYESIREARLSGRNSEDAVIAAGAVAGGAGKA